MEAKKAKITLLSLLLIASLLLMPVSADETPMLTPGGMAIGIHVEADGLLVVGFLEVACGDSSVSPAWEAGIRTGDLIRAVGPVHVTTAAQLREALEASSGSVSLRFQRGGREMQVTVEPLCNEEGQKELGVMLRSGLSGIGTLTFYDPNSGRFGALGHGVSDQETGVLLPLKTGFVGRAGVDSIVPGQQGQPGELKGTMGLDAPVGGVLRNTPQGIFGFLEPEFGRTLGSPMPVCRASEVRCGPALIRSDIDGTIREYQVEISRIYRDGEGKRDLLVTVTDPQLLGSTGGIVQGMSGSPIIQDGKLVGAVTHVLVNDPTRGYGIFIENMLEAAS